MSGRADWDSWGGGGLQGAVEGGATGAARAWGPSMAGEKGGHWGWRPCGGLWCGGLVIGASVCGKVQGRLRQPPSLGVAGWFPGPIGLVLGG